VNRGREEERGGEGRRGEERVGEGRRGEERRGRGGKKMDRCPLTLVVIEAVARWWPCQVEVVMGVVMLGCQHVGSRWWPAGGHAGSRYCVGLRWWL
jgi:hypothetical protein